MAEKKGHAKRHRPDSNRTGVPDGWTRNKVQKVWDVAMDEAKEVVQALDEKGKLGKLGIEEKDQAARDAMTFLIATMHGVVPVKERMRAAETILAYTLEKPATKAEHTINKAEEFLKSLMDED